MFGTEIGRTDETGKSRLATDPARRHKPMAAFNKGVNQENVKPLQNPARLVYLIWQGLSAGGENRVFPITTGPEL